MPLGTRAAAAVWMWRRRIVAGPRVYQKSHAYQSDKDSQDQGHDFQFHAAN